MWVAVENNVGTFGSNVTEVNNRPIGTKRFVCDESYPHKIYNKPSHLMKENCSGLTKLSGLDFGRILPSKVDISFRE